jgi:hypothetical protein
VNMWINIERIKSIYAHIYAQQTLDEAFAMTGDEVAAVEIVQCVAAVVVAIVAAVHGRVLC